ncbi:MAG TPA: cache and HAMP domain-containing protein [Opitutaceae bacterium]
MPPSASRPPSTEWWWILDPRRSLRARVALTVGAGSLLFSAALTWTIGATYRRTLEAQTSASFEALAFQLVDKLDRTLYERYRTLALSATLAPLRDPVAHPAEQRRLLDSIKDSAPEFAWVGFADRSGHIVAAADGVFENESTERRGWYHLAQRNAHAGPLHPIPELTGSASTGDSPPRYLDLAVPVLNADGVFRGVLAAHIGWAWARDVQLSVIPEALVGKHIGVTLYADTDVLLDSDAYGWTQPPEPPANVDPRRPRGAFLENTSVGAAFVTGFARSRGFRDYRGQGWLAVVRQPVEHAFAQVATLRRSVGAWAVSLSLAATIAAWFLAAPHARRLRSVRASAERIHEGDVLTVLPSPKDNSELSQMCQALDALVEDLRAKKK